MSIATKHFALLTEKLQVSADVTLVERLQRARQRRQTEGRAGVRGISARGSRVR